MKVFYVRFVGYGDEIPQIQEHLHVLDWWAHQDLDTGLTTFMLYVLTEDIRDFNDILEVPLYVEHVLPFVRRGRRGYIKTRFSSDANVVWILFNKFKLHYPQFNFKLNNDRVSVTLGKDENREGLANFLGLLRHHNYLRGCRVGYLRSRK